MTADELSRADVLEKVREHLSSELEIPPGRSRGDQLREDLDADSLDLYELVMELEDTYGISVSEEEAGRHRDRRRRPWTSSPVARRRRVAEARGTRHPQAWRSRRRSRPRRGGADLGELIAELPEELRLQAVTHSSWTSHRADPTAAWPFSATACSAGRRGAPVPALPARGHRAADEGARAGGQRPRMR
jgi:acyl carrier protein